MLHLSRSAGGTQAGMSNDIFETARVLPKQQTLAESEYPDEKKQLSSDKDYDGKSDVEVNVAPTLEREEPEVVVVQGADEIVTEILE